MTPLWLTIPLLGRDTRGEVYAIRGLVAKHASAEGIGIDVPDPR